MYELFIKIPALGWSSKVTEKKSLIFFSNKVFDVRGLLRNESFKCEIRNVTVYVNANYLYEDFSIDLVA